MSKKIHSVTLDLNNKLICYLAKLKLKKRSSYSLSSVSASHSELWLFLVFFFFLTSYKMKITKKRDDVQRRHKAKVQRNCKLIQLKTLGGLFLSLLFSGSFRAQNHPELTNTRTWLFFFFRLSDTSHQQQQPPSSSRRSRRDHAFVPLAVGHGASVVVGRAALAGLLLAPVQERLQGLTLTFGSADHVAGSLRSETGRERDEREVLIDKENSCIFSNINHQFTKT